MNGRSTCVIPSARHINVLAYNTVSGATQRDGNICPRGIPRIRNRVVLPGRVSFSKVRIKPSDNVDFVVTTIIRRARKIARTRHWSAIGDPGAASDVVYLDDGAWVEAGISAAEYINAVRGRVVNRRGIIEGTWNVRQRSPGVSNRIVPVKLVCRHEVDPIKAAHAIGESAVAGHRHRFRNKRIIGHNVPWRQVRLARNSGKSPGRSGRVAVRGRRAAFVCVSLGQREWNHADSEK